MEKKFTVLVVDDEDRIVYFLRSKLRVSGYEVVTAGNGKEAIEQFHKCEPDIIVLDLIMPEMDGFEFLKELRTFSNVPVIILSAKSDDADKIKGLTLGADDYLPKPFNPNELIARIEAINRTSCTHSEKQTIGNSHLERYSHRFPSSHCSEQREGRAPHQIGVASPGRACAKHGTCNYVRRSFNKGMGI